MDREILQLFDGKNVIEFEETTPQGNRIKGTILLNHGSFHGSLLINEINGEPTEQFIRGFPKIKYYEEDIPLSEYFDMEVYEKLDGTCVGFYQLLSPIGFPIEIVPKSRQKAVLDEHFQEMLKHCPTHLLYNKSWSPVNPDIVFYEMFGMLNEHTIKHKQTYIDLRLIGAARDDYMLPTGALKVLSIHFQIPMPKHFATVTPIKEILTDTVRGYNVNFNGNIFDMGTGTHTIDGQEMTDTIKKELDLRNKMYSEYHDGDIYYEGVVMQNCHDGYNHYLKIKPDSFFEFEGKTQLNVPISEIRKEVIKIINENIDGFNEKYNEKSTMKLITEYLQEEYSEEDVQHDKTQKVIKKELRKYIDSISDKSINRIVDELMENYPEESPSELMRMFARSYPLQKHRSGDVYFVLEKRLKRGDKS